MRDAKHVGAECRVHVALARRLGSKRIVAKVQTLVETKEGEAREGGEQRLGKKRKTKKLGQKRGREAVHPEPTLGSRFLHLRGSLWGATFCGLSGRGGRGRSGGGKPRRLPGRGTAGFGWRWLISGPWRRNNMQAGKGMMVTLVKKKKKRAM